MLSPHADIVILLGLEQVTGHDQPDHCSQPIPLLAKVGRDLVDDRTITKRQRPTECISYRFMDHRPRKLVLAVNQQKAFQPIHAVEFLLVEQDTG